jgi:hypothetical protein
MAVLNEVFSEKDWLIWRDFDGVYGYGLWSSWRVILMGILMKIQIWFVFVNRIIMLVYDYLLGIKFIYVLGLMLA